jgi:flavorubredoxin
MNKKRICGLICVIFIAGITTTSLLVVSLNSREIVQDVVVQNPDGSKGTVFVVFRPGLTSFNQDIVNEFIRGLIESDWRVEVTTSSQQTPTNVTTYDLIVLGSPVNGAKPHESMLAYLTRANFEGKPVVLILTSGFVGGPGLDAFENATTDANGVIISAMQFQIFEADARSRAYTAGTEISLGT